MAVPGRWKDKPSRDSSSEVKYVQPAFRSASLYNGALPSLSLERHWDMFRLRSSPRGLARQAAVGLSRRGLVDLAAARQAWVSAHPVSNGVESSTLMFWCCRVVVLYSARRSSMHSRPANPSSLSKVPSSPTVRPNLLLTLQVQTLQCLTSPRHAPPRQPHHRSLPRVDTSLPPLRPRDNSSPRWTRPRGSFPRRARTARGPGEPRTENQGLPEGYRACPREARSGRHDRGGDEVCREKCRGGVVRHGRDWRGASWSRKQ
jgi:hypothetical protein